MVDRIGLECDIGDSLTPEREPATAAIRQRHSIFLGETIKALDVRTGILIELHAGYLHPVGTYQMGSNQDDLGAIALQKEHEFLVLFLGLLLGVIGVIDKLDGNQVGLGFENIADKVLLPATRRIQIILTATSPPGGGDHVDLGFGEAFPESLSELVLIPFVRSIGDSSPISNTITPGYNSDSLACT